MFEPNVFERDLDGTLVELDRLGAVLGTDPSTSAERDDDWPRHLVDRAGAGGAEVDADVQIDPGRLPEGLEIVARRILEEAVTNAHRHGDGRWVRLRVNVAGDRIQLVVENSTGEGTGRSGASGSGLGVRGMKERAGLYGGSLTITPRRHALARPGAAPARRRPAHRGGADDGRRLTDPPACARRTVRGAVIAKRRAEDADTKRKRRLERRPAGW